MKEYDCWKCGKVMPFLDESEWQKVEPFLVGGMLAIKRYRSESGCDIKTARDHCQPEVMKVFEDITGIPGVHADVIYHHRLKDWGPECSACGNLLRTNKAKFCAECGKEI